MSQIVKTKSIKHLTHDVIELRLEKPKDFIYTPGQAVDISINKPEWKDVLSCFTFTSFIDDDYLEFVIKTYPSRKRVTNQLLTLKPGDEIIVQKPFGDISYKGEGIFIAGGAGITPFLAILKHLERDGKLNDNKLIFANKTKADIICEEKFKKMLGENFINILSDEKVEGYNHGYISPELIKKQIDNHTICFYLCGPDPMMRAVEEQLSSLGVKEEAIVKEGF